MRSSSATFHHPPADLLWLPLQLVNMVYGLATSTELSDATKYTWSALIILSFMGSLIWVRKLFVGFRKHLTKRIFGAPAKKSGKTA